jgi:hypothetical protein
LEDIPVRHAGFLVATVLACAAAACCDALEVTDIRAVHRHGQTFVTWTDVAAGEQGAKYRYSVYRSDEPITQANLARAERVVCGVLNNSAKLFGAAFKMADRLDPSKPTCRLTAGGEPLPMGSGLAVHTVEKGGAGCYAVVATDAKGRPVTKVVPGRSATAEPIAEKVAPIQPILQYDGSERSSYVPQTRVTGKKGLPLFVNLHASRGAGGGASKWGDYYLYFSPRDWGYRAGLPGVFSVEERKPTRGNHLVFNTRDAIERPDGSYAMETYWFGYYCKPYWSKADRPYAYPFTERRLEWMVDWVIRRYQPDTNRMYARGGSMGAWGSMTWAFKHPELFAAVYPDRPKCHQWKLPSLIGGAIYGKWFEKLPGGRALMPDGKTDFLDYLNMIQFAAGRHDDLPFVCWNLGRNDGYGKWPNHLAMVKTLTRNHHGFAFGWNNAGHGGAKKRFRRLLKYYPPQRFARNLSYPAFGNSSLDDDMGPGPKDQGDLEGFINVGFVWTDPVDEPDRWQVTLSNDEAKADMTVDVTPRRCQRFQCKPGQKLRWTAGTGQSGELTADRWGLVTVRQVRIEPGENTTLTIQRSD